MTDPGASADTYQRLLYHVKPYWRIFAAGIAAMVVLGLTEAGIPRC